MFISKPIEATVRRTLILGASMSAAMLGSLAAHAQTAAAAADTLEEVVVTGSRIARPDLEAPSPVLVISSDQLASQGLRNIADIAAQTPQFAASFGTSRTQSSFSGAAASGLNLVNLRNLGSVRSLVLINGRRAAPGRTTTAAVDFNTLPTANIDRVEVVTGGASAVYGADAVSGAVNIITKKVDGVEVGMSYSEASEGDNKNPGGYLMMGGSFAEGGHASLVVQYEDQGRVRCADRYLCAEDFAWLDPAAAPTRGAAARSGVGAAAKFQIAAGGPFLTSRNGSFTDASGALIPFVTSIDGYNRNAARTLAIPTKRIMVQAEGSYEIAENVSAFAEVNYGSSKTVAPIEGHPFQSTAAGSLFGGGPGVTGLQASIPVNNPFIPAAMRAAIPAATTVINWQQRFNQLGDRGATNERNSVRAVGGFKGSFAAPFSFGDNWGWEVSHVFARTNYNGLTDGLVGTDRLYYGLRVEPVPGGAAGAYRCVDAGARASGCIPINPFAPYTEEMKNYLRVRAGQSGTSEIEDTTAFLNATLAQLPAGDMRVVLGAERRSLSGFLDYDEVINRALATGNQIGDIDFVKSVTNEAFFETNVPILKDKKGVQDLQFDGSFRRSNPNSGDAYNSWGAGLTWEPINGLRVRVNKARAVRTPNSGELSGVGQDFGVVNDPCTATRRTANATRAANCLADGVPATYSPPLTVLQSVGGFVGGNPNLDPETGNTLTYGFVITPALLPGFSLSLDRFDIKVTDVISTVGRQLKADQCYDSTARLFCTDVIRGVNVNTPGNWALISVNDQNINVASYHVKGYDLVANYGFDVGSLLKSNADRGKLSLRLAVTINDMADEVALPGQPVIDLLGASGGSTSDQGWLKTQAVLDTNYRIGRWSANWHLRYIGKSKMAVGYEDFPRIPAHVYHDLRVAFAFKEGSEVYLGINNVLDKDPPFFATGASGTQALDTIPAYFDVFGRQIFGGVRVKL
jgi:outer membrane receptor protein involved in Fe transport